MVLFSVTAVCADTQKIQIKQTYNSNITGNSNPTDSTIGYVCDLKTLQRDTIYYNNHHQFGDTIKIHSVCIKEYPEKENLYNNRGNVYKMLKDYDRALADYDKAISLNSKYISPYTGKMSVFLMTLQFDKALEISNKILKLDPKSANAYYQRGIIYTALKDYDNAMKNFNLAIKYDPVCNPSAYFYRGNVYFRKRDYKSAIKDYKKSIECYKNAEKNNVYLLDYSAGEVFYNLGRAYIMVENYQNAIGCLDAAYKHYEAAGNKLAQKEIAELIVKVGEHYKNLDK